MTTLQQRPGASHLHLPRFRSAGRVNPSLLQTVWAASQDADDPASRGRNGWWSIADWASTTRSLAVDDEVIGLAAVHVEPGNQIAEGRVALLPDRRSHRAARSLVDAARGLARAGGAERLRLVVPRAASWVGRAARDAGFETIRAMHVMLRPASAAPLVRPTVPAIRVRPLRPGEEPELLAALNRAWADTWGFSPIPPAALAGDLRDQRDGMLVAVDAEEDARIVATVHAIFDAGARNVDGGPYAWISNLTTEPGWRGRGLGRLMLTLGVAHLRERGADSVMLGVDGGNHAAVGLYGSAGFGPVSTTDFLERPPGAVETADLVAPEHTGGHVPCAGRDIQEELSWQRPPSSASPTSPAATASRPSRAP